MKEAGTIEEFIATLQQKEAEAAQMLDAAHARVTSLREEEGAREQDIVTARKVLARQEESVADIERTITHVMPEAPAEDHN